MNDSVKAALAELLRIRAAGFNLIDPETQLLNGTAALAIAIAEKMTSPAVFGGQPSNAAPPVTPPAVLTPFTGEPEVAASDDETAALLLPKIVPRGG